MLGSRTIRTEEAILISLAALEEKLHPINKPKSFTLSDCIPQSEDTGLKQIEQIHKEKRKKPTVSVEKIDVSDDLSRFD